MKERGWVKAHKPFLKGDRLPPDGKIVLLWVSGLGLPVCGYIKRWGSASLWITYPKTRDDIGEVVAWCDCLPKKAPMWAYQNTYEINQRGRRHDNKRDA